VAEIVNLKRAKKAKARAAADEKAAANRVLHGAPKRAKNLAKALREKNAAELRARKLGDEPEAEG
jgi:Domain of unknown function (DUF4169)